MARVVRPINAELEIAVVDQLYDLSRFLLRRVEKKSRPVHATRQVPPDVEAMLHDLELLNLPSNAASGTDHGRGLCPASDMHSVLFYETSEFLCDRVADFLVEGARVGDSIIVIATSAHEKAIRVRLIGQGIDVDGAERTRRLTFLDARSTLSRFMVRSMPDWNRFRDVVGGALRAATKASPTRRLRAYGEMVNVLHSEGHSEAAVALEGMWNRIEAEYPTSLLCAYLMNGMLGERDIQRICATHGRVLPLEAGKKSGAIRGLVDEIRHRARVEETLRESIRDLRRTEAELRRSQKATERLARITSTIADAVTPEEISKAIVDEVALTVGASTAALWVVSGRSATLLRSVGYSEEDVRAFTNLPLDGPKRTPASDALIRGAPVWIDSQRELLAAYPELAPHAKPDHEFRLGCLPVFVQGRPFGVLAFTFDDAPPLDVDAKRFLTLTAKHSGQAIDRLHLLEADRQARVRADLLYRLAASVLKADRIEQVFDAAMNAIEGAMNTARSSVLLFDGHGVMRFQAFRGLSGEYRQALEGHTPWAPDAAAPEPVLVPDVERDPRWNFLLPVLRQEGVRSFGFFPLVAGDRPIGMFMVYFGTSRDLSPIELELARAIANNVASAVTRLGALDELKETVRFNEIFAGVLGHDLRNPLAAMMSAAQLASKRDSSQRLAKPLSRILSSGSRMARMIDQLLDFTRVRVGAGIPIQPRHTDLASLLKQAIDECDGAHPGGTFYLEVVGEAAGMWDSDRLFQAFSNLLGNAIEHGSLSPGVRVRVDGTRIDRVTVSVHNGGAIPEDILPRIFDPMVGTTTRRERSSGLGLGLFITKEIVRAHCGTIEINSSEGDGTTFVAALPRSAAARVPPG